MTPTGVHELLIIYAYCIIFIPLHLKKEYLLYKS